jgi:hypothetical protein
MSAQSERARPVRRTDGSTAAKQVEIGVVEHIHIATAAGAPVHAVKAVGAIAGVGLEGDRYAYGRGHYQDDRVSRDLTLVEAETIEALARDHGIELAAGETRRNVTTVASASTSWSAAASGSGRSSAGARVCASPACTWSD